MEINEIKHVIAKVDGWLTYKEGEILFNLASRCTGKGKIVEIGSWKGKSTIWLANGSKHGQQVTLYAIDPHTGSASHREKLGQVWTFDEFLRNIRQARVDDLIMPLVMTSEEAASIVDEPVELIFIDGAHEYSLVKQDFELWFPKVIDGGLMAFHDTAYPGGTWPGAKQVVEESIYRSKHFKNIGRIDSITFAEKVAHNSLIDRLRNRYMLVLKHMYERDLLGRLRRSVPRPVKRTARKLVRTLSGQHV